MDIRTVRPEEWPRLRELRLRALRDAPDAFGQTLSQAEDADDEQWRRWVEGWPASVDHAVLVAEIDEAWLGMAVADVASTRPDRANLFGMWVEPSRRGQGIGRALVDAVLEWARVRGMRSVHLGVTGTNPSAMAMYRRSGFVPTGVAEPLREGSDLVCVRMERRL
jgi:GNAT superfamily N-acetyltransferase